MTEENKIETNTVEATEAAETTETVEKTETTESPETSEKTETAEKTDSSPAGSTDSRESSGPREEKRDTRGGSSRPDHSRGGRPQGRDGQKMPKFRRKVCRFCHEKDLVIDYKNSELLERFITDRGKILPRRVTGTCAKHQRSLAMAVKRARTIALIPFIEK